ncbi:hypothetical protein [Neisseria musculi]|nr:hypothetical protein [Neisseria musculi]
MKKYRVLEQHFGDRQYWAGETRELHELDAAALIEAGLIAEIDGEAEAAAKAAQEAEKAQGGDLLDKAEAGAPQNKGTGDGNA